MNRDSSYTYIALYVVWYFNNKTVCIPYWMRNNICDIKEEKML